MSGKNSDSGAEKACSMKQPDRFPTDLISRLQLTLKSGFQKGSKREGEWKAQTWGLEVAESVYDFWTQM